MPDLVVTLLADFAERLELELGARSAFEWLLLFAPILIMLELPRYYLPLLGLLVARRLGLPRVDREGRQAFLRRRPTVSVVIAGRNEEATIEACIRSLLHQDWPELEILVVDDHSDDHMYEVARKYARRGLVRLLRNGSGSGRAGKPSAANLGIRVANGEFVICVDADTTFDRRLIDRILEPFADPRVGVVAGNVHCRNANQNLLTRLQSLEYALSIDLHKRWSDLFGCTLQGSGAITAFRRAGLMRIRGWEQSLAEDTDVSLRMVKSGWRIRFAPEAIAITEVPTRWKALARQRARWDRGGLRAYFKKHWRLLRPSVSGWSFATELWAELFFSVFASLAYPVYVGWLLLTDPWALAVALSITSAVYLVCSLLSLVVVSRITERIHNPWSLLPAALLTPFYKDCLRWVRIKATVLELLRVRYEDPFLPRSAWTHAPRY